MSDVPSIKLNDEVEIPQLGFGTYQIPQDEARDAVMVALEAGYRHIDTAQMYGNEQGVGQAVADSDLDRDEIFITSKLDNSKHGYDAALTSFDQTLFDLGVEYLDLFLIHWPLPGIDEDYVMTWKAMQAIKQSGKCRSIGVSNFHPPHLQRIFAEAEIVPSVNQIEVHPYFRQDEVRSFNNEHGIVTEAWSPIGQGQVVDDETLAGIGEAHGKSAAQVALRWHLQRGDVIFPKSATPERVRENFDLFDFELSEEEMGQVDDLDRGERMGPNPEEFNRA